jgi:hypothetical protein
MPTLVRRITPLCAQNTQIVSPATNSGPLQSLIIGALENRIKHQDSSGDTPTNATRPRRRFSPVRRGPVRRGARFGMVEAKGPRRLAHSPKLAQRAKEGSCLVVRSSSTTRAAGAAIPDPRAAAGRAFSRDDRAFRIESHRIFETANASPMKREGPS